MRNRTVFWLTCGTLAGTPLACVARPSPAAPTVAVAPAAAPAAAAPAATAASPVLAAPEPGEPSAEEDRQIAVLRAARASFAEFIVRAGTDPDYAEAVARSRDRIDDIDATIAFLEDGKRARLAESP
jgi:hypothetical protein